MFDARILAAVLVTLAAGTVVTGGTVPSGEDINYDGGIETGDIFDGIGRILSGDDIVNLPEPDNNLSAELHLEDRGIRNIPAENGDVEVDSENLSIEHRSLISDEKFNLRGFDGSIKIVNSTKKLVGKVETVETSGVILNGTTTLEKEIESDRIKVENIERTSLNIRDVTGNLTSSQGKTQISANETLVVESYSGNLTVDSGKDKIYLEGRVSQLEIGQFSIGE